MTSGKFRYLSSSCRSILISSLPYPRKCCGSNSGDDGDLHLLSTGTGLRKLCMNSVLTGRTQDTAWHMAGYRSISGYYLMLALMLQCLDTYPILYIKTTRAEQQATLKVTSCSRLELRLHLALSASRPLTQSRPLTFQSIPSE